MDANYKIIQKFSSISGKSASFPDDPMANALGAELFFLDHDTGEVRVSFNPDNLFLQGAGVIQGGALSAMLDFATACSSMSVLSPDQVCATISLTTSFMRPAPKGRYVVHSKIEKHGRSAIFAHASLTKHDQPNKPIANASAVLAVSTIGNKR